ncbi:MAG TPA: hypothetical protein VF384_12560 [Planctomycetota bacterium]
MASPAGAARSKATWVACGLALVAFWALRLGYWSVTREEPFSDMADFRGIAERFAAGGTLAADSFWQSYRSPVLPLLGALQIVLFGPDLLPWRWMQAVLLCAGACWLARELWLSTRSRWLAVGWLWLVALSKPSVFWSYKFAKEGLHEALQYVVLALVLRLLRRPSLALAALMGALAFAVTLNRTNFVFALVAIPALLVIGVEPRAQLRTRLRTCAPRILAFVAGAVLAWVPWGVRTWQLYGEPLFLTTDGACVVLDGLAKITVDEPDGSQQTIEYWPFLHGAPQRFPNDHEADVWLRARVQQGLLADPVEWMVRAAHNAGVSAFHREVSLTKVPRDVLLPSPWQWLLLDKHRLTVVLGVLGLFALALRHRHLLALGLLTVPPWVLACFMLGLPRYLEPMIPLLLFGNLALFVLVAEWIRARRRASRLTGS